MSKSRRKPKAKFEDPKSPVRPTKCVVPGNRFQHQNLKPNNVNRAYRSRGR